MSAFETWKKRYSKENSGKRLSPDRDLPACWNAALDELEGPSGVNAIPETNDYANGWNDCRKAMFAKYKARIKELRRRE